MKEKKQKKQRNIPRFGVLDAVIILLVIVAVVGVYFRYNIVDLVSGTSNMDEYVVSYSIEDIRYTTPNFINVGDKMYFSDTGEEFGDLIASSGNMAALSVTPASEYFTDKNGALVEVMYPNSQSRVDAKGRLTCVGRFSENGGFFVGGSTFIASGQYIGVNTDYVSVTIRVDEIAVFEEE